MSEQKQAIQPNTKVLAQFIRDLSFENILAQKGLDTNTPPDIKVLVNLDAKKRKSENQYEVLIKLSVVSSAKTEDPNDGENSKLFILEIEYGGIFEVTGFPPLNLEQINFLALYQKEIARRQAEAEKATKN